MSKSKPYSPSWRGILALIIGPVLGLTSGPFIVTRGFGVFPFISTSRYGAFAFWFFCLLACPILVSLLTDRWFFFLVPLSSLFMIGSLEYQSFLYMQQQHGDGAWAYMKKDIELDIGMAVFAMLISFLVAYVVHKTRKA